MGAPPRALIAALRRSLGGWLGRLLSAIVGLALLVALVHGAGPARVAHVLWDARSWMPVILALEGVQAFSDLIALRLALAERANEVPRATWWRSSTTAYAMMILLPAGRAAGEVTRATLIAKHVGVAVAAAASATLQASYTFGIAMASTAACAVVIGQFGLRAPLALLLAGNSIVMLIAAAILLAIARDARVARWLTNLRQKLLPSYGPGRALDPEAPTQFPWAACGVCTLSRVAQFAQYAAILAAVGGVVTARSAFIAHGIHLVGASLGDVVPNQLGVVDGTYRAFAPALGLGDAPARALSIAFVAHAAQLAMAGLAVLGAVLTREAPQLESSSSSARAGARS